MISFGKSWKQYDIDGRQVVISRDTKYLNAGMFYLFKFAWFVVAGMEWKWNSFWNKFLEEVSEVDFGKFHHPFVLHST